MKESVVEKLVKRYFEENTSNIWYMKTQGNIYSRKGAPDYTGSYNGLFFGVETKAGNGHPVSMVQMFEGMKIVNSGGLFVVAFSDFSDLETAKSKAGSLNLSPSAVGAKSALDLPKEDYDALNLIRNSINKGEKTVSFW